MGRLVVALGRLLIGRGLIDVLLRAAACLQQLLHARQCARLQLQHARGREQAGFRLQQIGAVDGEQRFALPDLVADVEERINDPAGIRREGLHQHVLIEVDRSDGIPGHPKRARFDRTNLKGFGLPLGQFDPLLGGVDRGRGGGLSGFGRGRHFGAHCHPRATEESARGHNEHREFEERRSHGHVRN